MKRSFKTALLGLLILAVMVGAQTKSPATFADYGQWETLAPGRVNGGFSPDGRWLAYNINRSNRNNELRVTKLADGSTKIAAFGAQQAFSSDSKWLAYSLGQSEADQEKLRSEKKPVQNKLGLLNLAAGETTVFDGIVSFAFSPDGLSLAMHRYGPERGSGASPAAGSDASEDTPGSTLIVRRLANGRDMSFGNVSQFAWQNAENGRLLAMTISAEGKTGNGVQLFDPETSILRVLDSSPSTYAELAWRKDAPDLAVLRGKTDERREGSTFIALSWTGLGGKTERRYIYDPTTETAFPADQRIISFRRPSWSEDGRVLFLGIAKWEAKAKPAGRTAGDAAAPATPASPAVDEAAAVEVWHWNDVFVMPLQKINANTDRRRNNLSAWHLDGGRFVPLGQDPVREDVTPIRRTNLAYVAEWTKYAMNRTIGRPAADLYLQDISTGARTKMKDNLNDGYVQAGPGGKYLLFLQDDHYWTINIATRTMTNITKTAPTSFINKESDAAVKQKPPFGVAGWTKDDAAVLLYDKYDLWQVASDGSKARRLTDGAAEEVRHRLVRLDLEEPWIDLGKPVYLSLFGEWTKKSGFAQLKPAGGIARLVWLDQNTGSLAKAKKAEVYGYVAQKYDDSPDLFVGGADLKDPKQVTATNPFQSNYAWGRSTLVDYKTEKGERLQGALHYPAGYDSSKAYPMIIYMYEKLSQNVHRYVAPSDREYYNISVFLTQGYFVFQPDIVFRLRQPGVSVVECVSAGLKKVLQLGVVDPKRVGIVGHSMGGFDAAFLATHTQGLFAAAVAGAPITDLVSYYGDHHWGTGIAETDHIETGQERMEVALYEDFQAYVDNSAVFNIHRMTVPLLLEAGDSDGIVAWHQSIELYNIARRAGKNVVMLTYMGEDHGLRQKKNQIDYQRRILAWFGHYLKGEPAEKWIAGGQSFLDREAEIKAIKTKK